VSENDSKGCLEVKYPFLCKKKLISNLCRENTTFCIKAVDDKMSLSTSHSYYYQVQTQMYVTELPWCDFVVWSDIEDIFVQRVYYNKPFMDEVILRAKSFYFNLYLPSVVSNFIISRSGKHSGKQLDNVKQLDGTKQLDNAKQLDSVKQLDDTKQLDGPRLSHLTKSFLYSGEPDVQIISAHKPQNSLPLSSVLQQLKLSRHTVNGDGSCLFHATAHQAGLIAKSSHGDMMISNHLRQLVLKMMNEHPTVRLEEGLSVLQWMKKQKS